MEYRTGCEEFIFVLSLELWQGMGGAKCQVCGVIFIIITVTFVAAIFSAWTACKKIQDSSFLLPVCGKKVIHPSFQRLIQQEYVLRYLFLNNCAIFTPIHSFSLLWFPQVINQKHFVKQLSCSKIWPAACNAGNYFSQKLQSLSFTLFVLTHKLTYMMIFTPVSHTCTCVH